MEKMSESKAQLLNLLNELKMNDSTITGAMRLLNEEEDIQKVIHHIQINKKLITDKNLRQYIAQILLWDKE